MIQFMIYHNKIYRLLWFNWENIELVKRDHKQHEFIIILEYFWQIFIFKYSTRECQIQFILILVLYAVRWIMSSIYVHIFRFIISRILNFWFEKKKHSFKNILCNI